MSCAAVAPSIEARLGEMPVVSGGTYTSGGGLSVAADLRPLDGGTLVCGVWAVNPSQSVLTIGKERRVMASGSVFLGREWLVQGLLFMTKVDPAASYAGAEAGCVRLERPWQPEDASREPVIRIPRQILVNETGDGDTGPVVEFIQTGPGAGQG